MTATPSNAGSVDIQPSSSKVTRLTKTIPNLQPGVTYTVLVRANKNGQYSDYASKTFTTPNADKSGNNFTVSNKNTDIQLLGGSFAASSETNPFPINIGKIDITQNTIVGSGTGVIMNQYGIAGFKAGTKQFSLSASTGDAYFAGTLSASAITSGGGALSSDLSNYASVSALTAYATKAGLGTTSYTTIHGGNITTGTISSDGYDNGTEEYFSKKGTGINLDSGTIRAQNFGIDSNGNAYFRGQITSTSGTIGGFTIGEEKIYSDSLEIFSTDFTGIGTGVGAINFTSGATEYSIYGTLGLFTIENSSDDKNILTVNGNEIRLGSSGTSGNSVKIINDSLNYSGVRNIYVSSTAGEPTPSSPQNGDIKLEW